MSINDQIKKLNTEIGKLYKKKEKFKKDQTDIIEEINKEIKRVQLKLNSLCEINQIIQRLGEPVIAVICNYFNIPKGRSFKTYVTFQELIDYKAQQQNRSADRIFKQYISFIDILQDKLKMYYPFISFEEIDLSWTTDQLMEYIVDAYFTRPICTINEIKSAREENNVEFLFQDIIKKM